jgi:hypothetical protein
MSISSDMENDRESLRPWIDKTLDLSSQPEQAVKKELWARHQAMLSTDRIPVSVTYEGIPKSQWDFMFGSHHMRCRTATGKEMEYFLKRVVWMAENVADDHIVWPVVRVSVPSREVRGWGVKIGWEDVDAQGNRSVDGDYGDTDTAKAVVSPFKEGIDFSALTAPRMAVDQEAWSRKQEEIPALIENRLDIIPAYNSMGYYPFDIAAYMRGLEQINFDPYDIPQELHRLMDFITTAVEQHHQDREKNGWINFAADRTGKYQMVFSPWRIHCSYVPEGYAPAGVVPKLNFEWAYITGQTSSGYGPDMFREFVHEYNCRLARHFTRQTVYYHGCEPLDQKAVHIKNLPNLRRFHVSPWSSVQTIAAEIQGRAVMEVHSHPGNVFLAWDRDQMRQNIRSLIDQAEGLPMDLNLSDINTLNKNPGILKSWAEIAREEGQRR